MSLGEKDPDAVIADRLLLLDEDALGLPEPAFEPPAPVAAAPSRAAAQEPDPSADDVDAVFPALGGITADTLAGLPEMDAPEEVVEFEASDAEWDEPQPVAEVAVEAAPADSGQADVFSGMRGKVMQDSAALPPGDHAARNFRVGQTYAAAAMIKEAADAFEKAARDPRYRFRSAQSLGRLYRKHGMLKEAVEWLDIASEAPAPKIRRAPLGALRARRRARDDRRAHPRDVGAARPRRRAERLPRRPRPHRAPVAREGLVQPGAQTAAARRLPGRGRARAPHRAVVRAVGT